MSQDSSLFKKVLAAGEEQLGKTAAQLMSNETLVASIQSAVGQALKAKGALDEQVSSALSAMHVPSTNDMQKLNDRLDELERIFESLTQKVDSIVQKLDTKSEE